MGSDIFKNGDFAFGNLKNLCQGPRSVFVFTLSTRIHESDDSNTLAFRTSITSL